MYTWSPLQPRLVCLQWLEVNVGEVHAPAHQLINQQNVHQSTNNLPQARQRQLVHFLPYTRLDLESSEAVSDLGTQQSYSTAHEQILALYCLLCTVRCSALTSHRFEHSCTVTF